jgi:uncharacterized membrane protein YphA (DoxX/SURF4 family)
MSKTLFNVLNTDAPAATLIIRLLAGLDFFAEGIKKCMFPADWGVGRFEKIGIIYPGLTAPFVGVAESVCGLLLIPGFLTRPAALLLLIDNFGRHPDHQKFRSLSIRDSGRRKPRLELTIQCS